jgi:cobalt-zinc-cadmium efflux system outer membrane protein
VAAADPPRNRRREADRAAERLAQAGLDLMRDARQAYADLALAHERVRVAGEAVKVRGRVAELAEKRLRAGDISPLDQAAAKIDALQAEQDAARVGFDVPVLEERLKNVLGVAPPAPLRLDPSPPPECREFDIDALTAEAQATRPDALAAAQGVEAAEARLLFAQKGFVRLLGIVDATGGRRTGNELGPGLRVTLPVFNRNQGAVARAEADLERAERNRQTVANQIALDVRRSYFQYRQACAELEVLRSKVRPEVEAAVRRAQGAFQEGNVTYLIVLETTRQLLDSLLREAVLVGDARRFWAELERGVGRRLAGPAGPGAVRFALDACRPSPPTPAPSKPHLFAEDRQ